MGVAGSIVGIDLGTTMSVVSHLDSSHLASTIPNRDGDPLDRRAKLSP
jgi:molecular chaperone DnaK (HSP70)